MEEFLLENMVGGMVSVINSNILGLSVIPVNSITMYMAINEYRDSGG